MPKYTYFGLLAAACALAACGAKTGVTPESPGFTQTLGPQSAVRFTLPKDTIGGELPSEGVGTENDPTWGTVGGYTQTAKAQVLAFPPGTTVTFMNLSKAISHTLNVVSKVKGPPAHFPPNPSLSTQPKGNGVLGKGFASGIVAPGKTVSIKLMKQGNYLIGCAFHYHEGMQDVIRVFPHATPGPSQ